MDRLPLRIALAAGATLATFLVCEAASRWLLPPPRYHREPVEFDARLGFRGIPHFREEIADEFGRYVVELNSVGLRGREIPTQAPRGVSRVAFVGDSFLVGRAVREEELVTSLVESALRSGGREIEVYNLSVIDFGTAQQLLLLRLFRRPLEPEAVVLFVYPANDLVNNSMGLAGRTAVSAGDLIRPYLVPNGDGELGIRYLHPLRARLRRISRLYATLERRVLSALGTRSRPEDDVERVRQGRAPREDLEIFRVPRDPGGPWAQAWESTFALLRAFRAECDAMGARLLVVVIPSVQQVVRTPKGIRLDISSRVAGGRPLDTILDWDLPERTLGRFLEAEGIEARSLLGPFREASAEGARVYARDEHLSARGHQIAAATVQEWLGREGKPASYGSEDRRSGPVRLLPNSASSPSLLDFRADPYLDYLGDGWISWIPPGSDAAPGWWIGPSALAVLPLSEGELVLRGFAPPDANFPIAGSLAIVGGSRHRFRIERRGRFTFRFPVSQPGRPDPPSAEGYLAVILAPGETRRSGGEVASSLSIEALGFEPAGVRGEGLR